MISLKWCKDSEEVAITVSGYIAKKLLNCSTKMCASLTVGKATTVLYFHYLSRENLTVSITGLAEFACSAFAWMH